jgi:hypothetical protein
MKQHIWTIGVAATLVAGYTVFAAAGTVATSESASIGLTSTRDKSVVSVMTDPVLANGRLVLKVAAHNRTDQPQQLRVDDVHVFTATGQPVGILSLDQLIAEARGTGKPGSGSMDSAHQASNYSRPTTSTNRSGELDVTGITGASDAIGRSVAERSSANSHAAADDAATRGQVDALKAGILQTLTIAPSSAAGGQVVTEKIKFSRKDERALRVVVDFNGEQHEFNFAAPPAK